MTTLKAFHIRPAQPIPGGYTFRNPENLVPRFQNEGRRLSLPQDRILSGFRYQDNGERSNYIARPATIDPIKEKFDQAVFTVKGNYYTNLSLDISNVGKTTIAHSYANRLNGLRRHPLPGTMVVEDCEYANVSYLSYEDSPTPIILITKHGTIEASVLANAKLLDHAKTSIAFEVELIDNLENVSPRLLKELLEKIAIRTQHELIVISESDILGDFHEKFTTVTEVEVNPFFTETPEPTGFYQTILAPLTQPLDSLIDELVYMGYENDEEINEERVEEIRKLIHLKTSQNRLFDYFESMNSAYTEPNKPSTSVLSAFPKKD